MSTFEFTETYRTTKRRRKEFKAKDDDGDVSRVIDELDHTIKTTEKLERINDDEERPNYGIPDTVNSNTSQRTEDNGNERKSSGNKRKLAEREDGKDGMDKNDEMTGKQVVEKDNVPKTVKPSDLKASKQLTASYGKVRRGSGLRLKLKGKSVNAAKVLSLKKTIDKKEKNKKIKSKKSKESKRKSKRLKYKTAEELLDERVKKKTDKFAWF